MIDPAFVDKLMSVVKRKAIHKLGARAIDNNYFSDRRTLVPIDDGSGFYRSRYVEIDFRDIPKKYLDIDILVPDFENQVKKIMEESKHLYEQKLKEKSHSEASKSFGVHFKSRELTRLIEVVNSLDRLS